MVFDGAGARLTLLRSLFPMRANMLHVRYWYDVLYYQYVSFGFTFYDEDGQNEYILHMWGLPASAL